VISEELHMLRLHHYRKRKKSGGACKRLKPPNSAAPAAESGGENCNTETNAIISVMRPYYDLHPTQASRGLARVKTERMAGRQQVRGVPKTAY